MQAAVVVMAVLVAVGMRVRMVMLVHMAMVMVVHMRMAGAAVDALLLLAVHGHRQVRAADAALLRRLPAERHPRNAQPVQLLYEGIGVGQQLEQRAGQHIARRAHAAVQIQYFHGSRPPYSALM